MIQSLFQIVSNECIARNTYKMVLSGDVSSINRPGQFVNIKLKGFFLRRPISVCDIDRSENTLTIVYKVVGKGTEFMSRLPMNEQLDVLAGLGNGYDTSLCGEHPLLIGGGAGVPPMFLLAKQLISEGKIPMVIAGFNTFDECFFEDEFKKIGARIIIATAADAFWRGIGGPHRRHAGLFGVEKSVCLFTKRQTLLFYPLSIKV